MLARASGRAARTTEEARREEAVGDVCWCAGARSTDGRGAHRLGVHCLKNTEKELPHETNSAKFRNCQLNVCALSHIDQTRFRYCKEQNAS